jgi:hypothetical protein
MQGSALELRMLPILMALLAQAAAPPPTPPSDNDITVTADRMDAETVERLTKAYVNSVLPTPQSGQFFRWHKPVCIKYSGLNPSYESRVTGRIGAIAAKAGVAMGKPGCAPNVLVVFTDNAGAMVDLITRKQPESLRHLTVPERNALRQSSMPVRWWYGIDSANTRARPKTQDPDKPADDRTLAARSSNAGGDSFNSASLISTNQTVFIAGAVVIVDVGLAEGTSLDALADYVAMVTLVPTRIPPKSPGVPSILALFNPPEGSPRPDGLSSWDWQLLTGVYSARADRDARIQKRLIVKSIKDEKTTDEK